LAELQNECARLGITVQTNGRKNKEVWIFALRNHYWHQENPGVPLPSQMQPMLLHNWNDLDHRAAEEIESDHCSWIVQPKLDGVRALLHVEETGIRVTGRCVSDVSYRLTEHQDNLTHLAAGLEGIPGTILDGELVCPKEKVDTGSTVTTSALQAAVAILSTRPVNAQRIQNANGNRLRFHVFDILRYLGQDVACVPLRDRLGILAEAIRRVRNEHIEIVPTFVVNKRAVHDRIIEEGGEGTVWKKVDQPYEPGRRARHWLKRKRSLQIEAFVSGFKPGSPNRGHSHLVGAVEFSVMNGTKSKPIAWVSNLTDAERRAMTQHDDGRVILAPEFLGRKAIIVGQDESGKSQRIRHARIIRWLEPTSL
jgi:ATP-dependent DNA ligase